jgi:hypothetical protein
MELLVLLPMACTLILLEHQETRKSKIKGACSCTLKIYMKPISPWLILLGEIGVSPDLIETGGLVGWKTFT